MSGHQAQQWCAKSSGICYSIDVWLPSGTPPENGWPVVYVLDGKAMFATFVEAIKRSSRRPDATGIKPAAVVGIAHGDDSLFATEHRYRDYTFEDSPLVSSNVAGGGADYLHFIVEQLAPELARDFRLNTEHQLLFGHSLAGYFVLNALALCPQAFSHYAAISPSVWWQPQRLQQRLQSLSLTTELHKVLVAVGEWEDKPAPWLMKSAGLAELMARRQVRAMVPHALAMATLLEQQLGKDRVHYRCFPEEDHASVVMIAIQRTLRLMFEQ